MRSILGWKVSRPVDARKAALQWDHLYRAFLKLGVDVLKILPQAARAARIWCIPRTPAWCAGSHLSPVISDLKERRPEEPRFIRSLPSGKASKIQDAAKGLFFEGEGDLLAYRDILFGGFRFRSEAAAHERKKSVKRWKTRDGRAGPGRIFIISTSAFFRHSMIKPRFITLRPLMPQGVRSSQKIYSKSHCGLQRRCVSICLQWIACR